MMLANIVVVIATLSPGVEIRVVAHRGLHGVGIAQNSVESFKAAFEAGAKWIETDFHQLDDGRILCVHDRKGALGAWHE